MSLSDAGELMIAVRALRDIAKQQPPLARAAIIAEADRVAAVADRARRRREAQWPGV